MSKSIRKEFIMSYNYYATFIFKVVSALRGQIKLDPRQHLSPLEALFKISDEHLCHFHRGIPLPRAANRLLKGPVINYLPKFSLTWPIFFQSLGLVSTGSNSIGYRCRTYSFGTCRTTEF